MSATPLEEQAESPSEVRGHPLRDTVLGRLSARFRQQRLERLVAVTGLRPGMRVLDLGGQPYSHFLRERPDLEVTYLNLDPAHSPLRPNERYLRADATRIPARDDSYDVVIANSLIEHVPTVSWPLLASEIARVAPVYFVQAPYRYFPLEPHYNVPLAQFAPERAQRWIAAHWWLSYERGYGHSPIRLPARRDFQRLFPGARVEFERLGPLPKALIAWRGPAA